MCALLNEILFARLKAEQYYQKLAARIKSNTNKHKLRKPVTELQMKAMQVVATLRDKLTAHIVSRLETTCLQSYAAQNWRFHKDSFTSTSWVDRVSAQVNPFESTMAYVSYVEPRSGKKSLVLSPSRALTTWRMQMIQLFGSLGKGLAPFEYDGGVTGQPRNSLVRHIFS